MRWELGYAGMNTALSLDVMSSLRVHVGSLIHHTISHANPTHTHWLEITITSDCEELSNFYALWDLQYQCLQ